MTEQKSEATRTLSYRAALREALIEEMERDERVFMMGQDAGPFGGVFGVSKGLTEMFGADRVFDTPISEAFIVGGGVGAALAGARPVVELQYADFALISMDEIVNKAAKWRYMHGGGQAVPLVIRAPEGVVGGLGPEHSQSLAQYFWHSFGLKVAMPATPADAKGMLKSAIRDDDPVLFLENKSLYNRRGPVPEGEYLVPLGVAANLHEGDEVTVVAWSRMTTIAMKAADELAENGIGCEVIDPRGIRPLDLDAVLRSVERTGRLVVVHEGPVTGGLAGELITQVVERAFGKLKAAPVRVAGNDSYVPQNLDLEGLLTPDADAVVKTIEAVMAAPTTKD
ncbi:alpha-ketoacid dehydrogenase subunit beta [Alteriqipengyuania sp.]|uniref:alpha-ketoacid dehydrogenase subunit beta n=1 Tax=Alteriqipengyuania sp. TaxID=2800692 RepID=UPI003511AC91